MFTTGLLQLSILYLRCLLISGVRAALHEVLSILYLRCINFSPAVVLDKHKTAFNSLFEMRAKLSAPSSTVSARLSILYLRCYNNVRQLIDELYRLFQFSI